MKEEEENMQNQARKSLSLIFLCLCYQYNERMVIRASKKRFVIRVESSVKECQWEYHLSLSQKAKLF
uniref:Uncharacterized protein n=1 Tax=Manihot esculenta TaxID=3983 RepID=A0A2C9VWJ5_MANES